MPTTLTTLPAELRLKIYRTLFILDPIEISSRKAYGHGTDYNFAASKRYGSDKKFNASSQLLRVCGLFLHEGVPVLYGENTFVAGTRAHTKSFMNMLETRNGHFRKIQTMTFDGLENLKKNYGFSVLERAPRLRNLILEGTFQLDAGEVADWDEAVGSLEKGNLVRAGSAVHAKLPSFPQSKMDRFKRRGTNMTAVANVPAGWTPYDLLYQSIVQWLIMTQRD